MVDASIEVAALHELETLLDALIPSFRWSKDSSLKLERIEALVERLDNPQSEYRTVHVGGTSGKGTISAMVASILSHHGYRTGLHLSPYVQTLTETWQIDGRYLLPTQVLPMVRTVINVAAPISTELLFGAVSYFETKVATAFALFAQEHVDIAVIEVGLGGALDATNVLGSGVQILTNVSLDHTEILGDTVEKIATDKVEIFKPDSFVLSGVVQPSVKNIARRKAAAVKADLWILDDDIAYHSENDVLDIELPSGRLTVDVPRDWPDYQRRNAALATIAACHVEPTVSPATISGALRAVHLPARFERFVERGRPIVLDGAHNPEKMRSTVRQVQASYPGMSCVGVLALKEDKDVRSVLSEFSTICRSIILTTFTAGLWKPLDPEGLAASLRELGFGGAIAVDPDPRAAVEAALNQATEGDVVVVTGSLYLAGNVRSRWIPSDEDLLHGSSYELDT